MSDNKLCSLAALWFSCVKVLKVDLNNDTYAILKVDRKEKRSSLGFSDCFTKWVSDFAVSGQVASEDIDTYMTAADLGFLRSHFDNSARPLSVCYRRKLNGSFCRVTMEIIPGTGYGTENRPVYLYVRTNDVLPLAGRDNSPHCAGNTGVVWIDPLTVCMLNMMKSAAAVDTQKVSFGNYPC